MKVVFDPLAKLEFDEAREYYDVHEPGLGERFRIALWAAIEILERFPEIGREVRPGIRRILVKRFPYKLIYSVTESGLYIIAVAHGHRRPNYWADRA